MRHATMTRPAVLSAATIIGTRVRNSHGEDIGSIEELMVDVELGKVAYAVICFGGFLGLGEKFYAIPWTALRPAPRGKEFILDVPKEKLDHAPRFEKNHWPDCADREWLAGVYNYYDYAPYWN